MCPQGFAESLRRRRCPHLHWDGQAKPPEAEAEAIRQRVTEAADLLCKRVAQEAIRKILENSGEPSIQTLLDIVTASKISELARVLTPEMVNRVRLVMASASVDPEPGSRASLRD